MRKPPRSKRGLSATRTDDLHIIDQRTLPPGAGEELEALHGVAATLRQHAPEGGADPTLAAQVMARLDVDDAPPPALREGAYRRWVPRLNVSAIAALLIGVVVGALGWQSMRPTMPPVQVIESRPIAATPSEHDVAPPGLQREEEPPRDPDIDLIIETAAMDQPITPILETFKVQIVATPWARLSIDGKALGLSPQSLHLPEGTYEVEAHHPPSGKTKHRTVQVTGEDQVVRFRFGTPPPRKITSGKAKLIIVAKPWGKVKVDGKSIGNTPRTLRIDQGADISIEVSHPPSGKTETQHVTVTAPKQVVKFNFVE